MSKIEKLGLGIVAFEGTEHLKNITFELRPLCDHIVVCLQKKSYHGDDIPKKDVSVVNSLKKHGFIDKVIWFEPIDMHEDDKESGPRMIETDKRNYILDYLEKKAKCSHSMIIDSDEYYEREDFRKGKQAYEENDDITVSYCQYVNYYKDYRHVMVWPFECFVPFITEAKHRFKFNHNIGVTSDLTRRYFLEENHPVHIINYNIVKMHHFSWIRENISMKIRSWSSKKLFSNIDEIANSFLERFKNYKDGDNALIMFNVPEYNVIVNTLPAQYVMPRFGISEKVTKSYDEYCGPDNVN